MTVDLALALVRGPRPDQLVRSGTHRRVGPLTVRDLLHEWIHHDRNHTRELLANVQARVWPIWATPSGSPTTSHPLGGVGTVSIPGTPSLLFRPVPAGTMSAEPL